MSRFLEDPSHPGLNFERMQGRPGFWSIRTNKGFRIILKETDDPSTFMLADVGKHDPEFPGYLVRCPFGMMLLPLGALGDRGLGHSERRHRQWGLPLTAQGSEIPLNPTHFYGPGGCSLPDDVPMSFQP